MYCLIFLPSCMQHNRYPQVEVHVVDKSGFKKSGFNISFLLWIFPVREWRLYYSSFQYIPESIFLFFFLSKENTPHGLKNHKSLLLLSWHFRLTINRRSRDPFWGKLRAYVLGHLKRPLTKEPTSSDHFGCILKQTCLLKSLLKTYNSYCN